MMKRTMFHCVKTIAVSGAILLATSIACNAAEYVSVKKDGVNVRTGPGTDNPVYMELFQGYPLEVVEKKDDWIKIRDFEKDSGWIHSSLVSEMRTVIVNAQNKANMRSGPSTGSAVVASIDRGVVLDVVERKDKWVKVKHISGTQGWIYAPLLWP